MPDVIASVKALIRKDGKYLFLSGSPHKITWDLPGGKIEYGEEPEDALRREVREETGLEINILKPIGVWWFYSKNHNHQVVCFTYLCEPAGKIEITLGDNPAVDEQIGQYHWVEAESIQADEVDLSPSLGKLLHEFLTI